MSEFNSILSDKELRDLLRQYIMEHEEDHALTEQLIDMESKIAFGPAALTAVALPNETEMITRLSKGFAGKSGLFAWTIGLGISAAIGLGIYQWSASPAEWSAPATRPQPAPHEQAVPDAAPGFVPLTPQTGNNPLAMVTDTGRKQLPVADPVVVIHPPVVLPPAPIVMVPDPPLSFIAPDPFVIVPDPVVVPDAGRKNSEGSPRTSIDTSFTGVKRIVVEAGVCHLKVSKTGTDRVTVKGQVNVEVKGLIKKTPEYNIRHERRGDELHLWVEQNKSCSVIAGSININGSLELEVPAGTDTDLSASNDITVNGLDGRLCRIRSSYGNITATRINTGFELKASSGDITVSGCTGGGNVASTYGDVSITDHKGNIDLRASSGNVSIKGLSGDQLDVKSSYGNIQVYDVQSPVSLMSSSGDIHVERIKGNLNVQSAYGNQELRSITGNLLAISTSGDVRIEGLRGDMDVRSTYGNVHTANCAGRVLVRSQSGNIKGKNITVYDEMTLSAVYGDIKMQLDNALDDLSFDLTAVSGDVSVKKNGTSLKGEDGRLQLAKGKIRVKGTTSSGSQLFE